MVKLIRVSPVDRSSACRWDGCRLARLVVSALLGELRLDRGDARLELQGVFARTRGHVLDRVEFLAADEVEPAERFLHPLARAFAGLAGHPGERAGGAIGELDEVGDDRVFALHGAYLVRTSRKRKRLKLDPLDRVRYLRTVGIGI